MLEGRLMRPPQPMFNGAWPPTRANAWCGKNERKGATGDAMEIDWDALNTGTGDKPQ